MKKLFCVTFFFAYLQVSAYQLDSKQDIRTCGIVSSTQHFMEGKLSDYWAQELIGADLSRKEVKQIPPPAQANFISVFDGDRHGLDVRNLISSPSLYALLPDLGDKISLFQTFDDETHRIVSSRLKARGGLPSFINNSQHWMIRYDADEEDESYRIYKVFKELSPQTILVTAGGNYYPGPLNYDKIKASEDFHAVVVGSFSPYGFVSEFSQEGEELHILAPSDDFIVSDSGHYLSLFGGTSGATPLVTGALAGFEWISGYHPTGEEAKILLEKTAVPTLHSHENPRQNGVGLVNPYKLARLAFRLKAFCDTEECFSREIKKDENYRFPKDKALQADVVQAFPACSFEEVSSMKEGETFAFPYHQVSSLPAEKDKSKSLFYHQVPFRTANKGACRNKQEIFNRLRQEVLLSPDRQELWESLSCIYREAGFEQNALMLDRLALALLPTEEVLNRLLLLMEEFGETELETIARLVGNIGGPKTLPLLSYMIENEDPYIIETVAYALSKIGGEEALHLLAQRIEDKDPHVRELIARSLGWIEGEGALLLLAQMSEDKAPNVREAVVRSLGRIESEEALPLLAQRIEDKDLLVKNAIAYSLIRIGGEKALLLLDQMIENKDPTVRTAVADSLSFAKDINVVLPLLSQLIQDEDPFVREAVVTILAEIGKDEILPLLSLIAEDEDPFVREAVFAAVEHIAEQKESSLARLWLIRRSLYEDYGSQVTRRTRRHQGQYGE